MFLDIKFLNQPKCSCVEIATTNGGLSIRVDKRNITSVDTGKYSFSITLTDPYFGTTNQKSTYIFSIQINFIPEPPQDKANPPKVKPEDLPAEASLTEEIKAEGITPFFRSRQQTRFVADEQEVLDLYDEFLKIRSKTKFEPKKEPAKNATANETIDNQDVVISIANISQQGEVFLQFNQPLLVPPFTPWRPYQNQPRYDWQNGGYDTEEQWAEESFMGFGNARKLLAHESLNVTRDVLTFEFLKKSNVEDQEITFDLYIKEWEPTFMVLQCNFTSPQVVSSGVLWDQARVTVRKRFLFVSEKTGEEVKQVNALSTGEFPKQFSKEDDATWL